MPSSWYKTFMSGYGFEIGSYKPGPKPKPGPPMDLANMRHNGVRSIRVRCLDCSRENVVNLDQFDGALTVKSFERRMRCDGCGSMRSDVRPAWR